MQLLPMNLRDSAGTLDGGPQCRMSILRNGNVACRYFCNFNVDFKIAKYRLSNLGKAHGMSLIFFHMSMGFMSHVDFWKWPCRPVDFKGQGPQCMTLVIRHVSIFSQVPRIL